MNFLAEIVARKLEDARKLFESGVADKFKADIARRLAPKSLKAALEATAGPAVIAEIKRASPSKGELGMGWDPVELAQIYQDNGAAAISVLTEVHYFKGDPDFIRQMRPLMQLPLLRKDFILEPIQVYETAPWVWRSWWKYILRSKWRPRSLPELV
jgi:indole-3-glycerol phosphate synthase